VPTTEYGRSKMRPKTIEIEKDDNIEVDCRPTECRLGYEICNSNNAVAVSMDKDDDTSFP
jgi:hypothetical protein